MVMNQAWVARQEETDESRRFHERERLSMWTMDSIAGLMDDKSVSKSELARKMDKSRSYITQLFSGSKNPTLFTVADIAWALGYRASMKFEPLRNGDFISLPVQTIKTNNIARLVVANSKVKVTDNDDDAGSIKIIERFVGGHK